ncbi:MAG TPA: type II toxin-antitoxin system RelE/ParE family toxin [Candidatus Nanoarchaeia archaeon]|nr:type II toxin-antitoxin system RelE/ParE family toxin [Candidatus Nanoarchaeia archaeon]
MSFSVSWHPKAAKYVENLPKETATRILEQFDKAAIDPFKYLEHFEGDYYKLRIGDYRALIDIDFQNKIIKIRVFDKRGRIY